MGKTVALVQGSTMDVRKMFSDSSGIGQKIHDMQAEWQKTGVCALDLERICARPMRYALVKTKYEQPAIFAVSLARFSELKNESSPDVIIGHSLGEYAALCAAGVFSPKDGIVIMQRRGELCAWANEQCPGAMAAIIGKNLNTDFVEKVCREKSVDIACVNSSSQVMISGEKKSVEEACAILRKNKIAAKPMATECAFHSRRLECISEKFRYFLDNVEFCPPKTPIFMNATARYETNPETIKDCLARQLTGQVNFPRIAKAVQAAYAPQNYCEIGVKPILTEFFKEAVREQ